MFTLFYYLSGLITVSDWHNVPEKNLEKKILDDYTQSRDYGILDPIIVDDKLKYLKLQSENNQSCSSTLGFNSYIPVHPIMVPKSQSS